MEKVIPQGLNYADMKPEAIQNMIKLVRYTPVSNVQSADPNDVIRFQMQGNGFYDPYSAYIKVTVEPHEIPVPTGVAGDAINGLTLDRSAHSLINRLVIKSSGTEIERIENYDVVAAMINDMIYSHEQNQFHHYEGFPSKYRRESVPNGSVQRTAA